MPAAVWRREWERFLATPRLWVLVVLAPLLLALLVLWIFSQRTPLSLPVLLADYDHTVTSRTLARQLQATPSLDVRPVMPDMVEAASRIRRGEAYGVIVIPPDLERALLRSEVPVVSFYYNRQMLTASNMMVRDVRTVVATLGASIGLERGIAPAVLMDVHPAFNPGMDYTRFLALPLILAILHIAIVVVAVDVTGRELREGTAGAWLTSARGHVITALAGKLLPYGLWFVLFGLGFLALSLRWLGISFNGSVWLWAAGWVALVFACLGLGALLVVLTGNLRMATSIASLLVSPAFAFAGLTFPTAFMPAFAEFWAQLLPLTHGLAAHVQQSAMAAPAEVTLRHLLSLAPFVLLPLLLRQRWRRLMTDPACWGAV